MLRLLVKRPLLVDEYRALVGFNKVEWASWCGKETSGKIENGNTASDKRGGLKMKE